MGHRLPWRCYGHSYRFHLIGRVLDLGVDFCVNFIWKVLLVLEFCEMYFFPVCV